ncbi:hypothetical protein [Salisediminibacterium beveridgei]|uniref:Uncharacterized protein n=1 Tax=Salisediminibacterium beveridgei TaxID=632773 RepID=A0A1D7QTJ0_9BACI|nr:hypothetical protein [Salisediminibacterium beveridgei]AOM82295.1 hypothetical protein BBEV_0925 [Salisediminibacterium beveridgei]
MYHVTDVTYVNEEGPLVFTVMFHVNDLPTVFATDLVYAVQQKEWLANPFITHDLQALMSVGECALCGETKVACHPLIGAHREVKERLLAHPAFQRLVRDHFNARQIFKIEDAARLRIATDKQIWDELVKDNERLLKRD